MVRASRIFLATYAVLLAVLAVVAFIHIKSHFYFVEHNDVGVSLQWWSESGAMAAAYLVLAAGLMVSRVPKRRRRGAGWWPPLF
jgi:hypothetical protein